MQYLNKNHIHGTSVHCYTMEEKKIASIPVQKAMETYEKGITGLLNNEKMKVLETYKVDDFVKVDHNQIYDAIQEQLCLVPDLAKIFPPESCNARLRELENSALAQPLKGILRICLGIGFNALTLRTHLDTDNIKLTSMMRCVEKHQSMMEELNTMSRSPVTIESIREKIVNETRSRARRDRTPPPGTSHKRRKASTPIDAKAATRPLKSVKTVVRPVAGVAKAADPVPAAGAAKEADPVPEAEVAKTARPVPAAGAAKEARPVPAAGAAKEARPVPAAGAAKAVDPVPGAGAAIQPKGMDADICT